MPDPRYAIRYRPDTDLGRRFTGTSAPFDTREAAEHRRSQCGNADELEVVDLEPHDPDALTVCIEHGAFIPCRKDGEHHLSQDPIWVRRVRDYHAGDSDWGVER